VFNIVALPLSCRKGAPTTPLITIAMSEIVAGVLDKNNLPGAIFTSFCGGAEIGQAIARDTRIPLVSFTGSSKVLLCAHIVINSDLIISMRVHGTWGLILLI